MNPFGRKKSKHRVERGKDGQEVTGKDGDGLEKVPAACLATFQCPTALRSTEFCFFKRCLRDNMNTIVNILHAPGCMAVCTDPIDRGGFPVT